MNAFRISFLLVIGIAFSALAQETSTISRSDNGRTVFRHSSGYNSFDVEVRGRIEITDDDKDIKSMSADGYLEITKTVFGSKRTLVITAQNGGLKREYYEGRTLVPYEPEGRKWLNEIMPELVRSTTIGAESRVNRFYRQGGASAVLNEIGELESDYVKHHYATLLVGQPGLSSKDYPTIIKKVAEGIDSDYYLSEFLRKNLNKFLTSREAGDALFAACREIDSDHYVTEVIKEALKNQSASPEAVKVILAASSEIESDHYKTEVLTTLMKQPSLPDAVISEMINTSKTIDSDHYRTVVLTRALSYNGLSATSYERVLESVSDIDSDHYKTEVLTDLLEKKLPTDQIFNLVNMSGSIDSDHYLSIVFKKVLENQELNDEAFKSLIDRASEIDSDHYASTILKEALDLPNLNDAKVMSILSAAGNIESDHYITEVLVESADRVKSGSAQLRDAYRSAARRIGSETYYGRALKAID